MRCGSVRGAKLNQTRILFVSVLLAICYVIITKLQLNLILGVSRSTPAVIFAIAIPLSIAILFSFEEGNILGLLSLLRLLAVAGPFVLVCYLFTSPSLGLQAFLRDHYRDVPNAHESVEVLVRKR